MWRYREMMPIFAGETPVSLGEGFTPLLRAPRVGAGQHGHGQGEVVHAAGQRTGAAQPRPGVAGRGRGHDPGGGPEAGDAAERGRVAQGPAHVGAVGHRLDPARDGRGRAAAGPARAAVQGVGIGGGAEELVEGVGAGGELRHVVLAGADHARVPQPLDDQVAVARDLVGEQGRAHGRADARGRVGVLVGHGYAVQRRQRAPAGGPPVGLVGRGERLVPHQGDDGVEDRVDLLDAGQVVLDDLTP